MDTSSPKFRPMLRDGLEPRPFAVRLHGLGALIDLRANVALRWLCRASAATARPGLVLVR